MSSFDKELRKRSKKIKVPENYEKKIEEILIGLPAEKQTTRYGKRFGARRIIQLAVCILVIVGIGILGVTSTDANIFESFKKTIMSFFESEDGSAPEKLGVKSQQNYAQSKSDLMLELRESIIDRNSIYLLVKVTAPADVVFDSDVGFEYFAFYKEQTQESKELLGGVTDCRLLEVLEEEHAATYVVSLSTTEEIVDGASLYVTFKNMMQDPNGDDAQLLVEGLWSFAFTADYTVTEQLSAEGVADKRLLFLEDEATVRSVVVTPLGMELSVWITQKDYELAAVSNDRLDIRLKMLDDSEAVLMCHDIEVETPYISSAGMEFSENEEGPCVTYQFEFEQVQDLKQVLGVCVDDVFVPLRNIEES